MRDLTVVGLSEDGRHLVLRGPVGELFRVPADDRLRATLRNDRARLGQLEIAMDSALRPRDIQARIRRGESPEEVAAAADIPVDRIMGYAFPVLAEREHMAERARGATVRRKHAQSNAQNLGESVDATLRSRGIEPESATWDSWRRDDGRWTVTVRAGAVSADYVFDPAGRYTFADDEGARELVGDVPEAPDATEAIADAVSRPVDVVELESDPRVTSLRQARARRAAAVNDRADDQLSLTDVPGVVDDDGRDAGAGDASTSTAAAGASGTHAEDTEPTLELGEHDPSAAAGQARHPSAQPPKERTAVTARDAESTEPRGANDDDRAREPVDEPAAATGSEDETAGDAAPRKRTSKRRERRRVPSWDEIMFGDKG